MENDTLNQIVTDLGIGMVPEMFIKSEEPTPTTSEDSAEQNAPVTLNTEELENIFVSILDEKTCTPNIQYCNQNCIQYLQSIGPEPSNITAKSSQQHISPYTEPYLKIIEEPGDTRFRFKTEGRGTLHGLNTTKDMKTYPTVQIVGFNGPAKVLVSCVEDSKPYRSHPHQIIGKGECKEGVCIVTVQNSQAPIVFQHLGIARVKVKEILESLTIRENQKIDPFNQGFELKYKAKTVSLHDVRLCFQAYLGTKQSGFTVLNPVVSRIIRNKEPNSDLQITNYSDDKSSVKGGKKILLFCGKIHKDDIEVHFEVPIKGRDKVTLKGTFSPEDIHKQCAIAFKTPPFLTEHITEPVKVNMLLYKPSDKTSSDPIDFWYVSEPATPVTGPPASILLQQHFEQPFKTPQKRPKEREPEQEQSTGRICIPATRAKSQDDEYKGLTTHPVERKSSFIDQVMAHATRDQVNQASNTIEDNSTTKQSSMELPNLNTDEILDLAHNMNTENIDAIRMKLSDSLKLSGEQTDLTKNT